MMSIWEVEKYENEDSRMREIRDIFMKKDSGYSNIEAYYDAIAESGAFDMPVADVIGSVKPDILYENIDAAIIDAVGFDTEMTDDPCDYTTNEILKDAVSKAVMDTLTYEKMSQTIKRLKEKVVELPDALEVDRGRGR
ncbi:hypothetical protein FACS1894187_14910 [Synergistales bacterium]|nr:hypothetical protein FACS1894187_14910 [Synergistales bacterium]